MLTQKKTNKNANYKILNNGNTRAQKNKYLRE